MMRYAQYPEPPDEIPPRPEEIPEPPDEIIPTRPPVDDPPLPEPIEPNDPGENDE